MATAISVLRDRIDALIVGKGSGDLALFSSIDHSGAGTYVRNTTVWTGNVNLTGIPVYQGGSTYGYTPISAWHCIAAHHTGNLTIGAILRWVTSANVVVERTIADFQQVGSTDIWIVLLNAALPASIQPFRIADSSWKPWLDWERTQSLAATGALPRPPMLVFDQEHKALIRELIRIDTIAVEATDAVVTVNATDTDWDDFTETLGAGDSGWMTAFVVGTEAIPNSHNGEHAWSEHLTAIQSTVDSIGPGGVTIQTCSVSEVGSRSLEVSTANVLVNAIASNPGGFIDTVNFGAVAADLIVALNDSNGAGIYIDDSFAAVDTDHHIIVGFDGSTLPANATISAIAPVNAGGITGFGVSVARSSGTVTVKHQFKNNSGSAVAPVVTLLTVASGASDTANMSSGISGLSLNRTDFDAYTFDMWIRFATTDADGSASVQITGPLTFDVAYTVPGGSGGVVTSNALVIGILL